MSFQELKTDNIDLLTINDQPYVPFNPVGNGVLLENGGIVNAIVDGAQNQILTTNGANNPTWRTLGTGIGLLYSNIASGVTSTNSIPNGTNGQVLAINGGVPSYVSISLPPMSTPSSLNIITTFIQQTTPASTSNTIATNVLLYLRRIGQIVTLAVSSFSTITNMLSNNHYAITGGNFIPVDWIPLILGSCYPCILDPSGTPTATSEYNLEVTSNGELWISGQVNATYPGLNLTNQTFTFETQYFTWFCNTY